MRKTLGVSLFGVVVLIGLIFFPVAVQAGVSTNPTSLNFGSVAVNTTSAPVTLTITNTSRQNISIGSFSSSLPEFVISGPAFPLTLRARSSAYFQVKFKPVAAVAYTGEIIIHLNHTFGLTHSVSVSGTGAAASAVQTYQLSASSSSLSFGNILLGSSGSQVVTVTNTGTGNVSISQVAISGTGFRVTGFSGTATLAAGQSLPLTVALAPAAVGSAAGSLTMASNASNSPATIALSGAGVQPSISVVSASVAFGNLAVGVTNTQTLTIKNPGTANLTVSHANLSGSGFSFTGLTLPVTLAPNASTTATLSFTPISAGAVGASLSLVNNSPTSPLAVSISGTGVAQTLQLSASPASLSFGSLTDGTTASQTVTLSNTGNANISLSQISVSGTAYSSSGLALPLTLTPGQTAQFSVTFAPTTSGALSGTATVTSNAANSPASVALSGTGAAPASHSVALNWSPTSSSYNGFNVYRGSKSGGPYTRVNSSMVSTSSYTDSSVTSGSTFYYVATEVGTDGVESSYSNEASANIP
jgi:Abnormal spindle-like microcephaly-assoc'd, ASPM-SPD-2-Hydin/Cep192 domain 4/HYDIN/CFA65/VesB-like, Ig-like domain